MMRFCLLFLIPVLFDVISCHFRTKIKRILKEDEYEIDETRLRFLEYRDVDEEWKFFKSAYDRRFENENEEIERRRVFERLDRKIVENQKRFVEGEETFVLGHNKFSDLSEEEFQSRFLRAGKVAKTRTRNLFRNTKQQQVTVLTSTNRTSYDLKMTEIPVKDQGQCGSCWAFSGVGVIEYNLFVKYGKYIELSDQTAMDCGRPNGCNGGFPEEVYKYYLKRGLPTETLIPYIASNQNCRSHRSLIRKTQATIYNGSNGPRSWFTLNPNTEENLKAALDTYGWLSVCLNANRWQSYMGGVMTDNEDTTEINHAVILVGYGTDNKTGLDYWNIRNSWGTDWGEGGYIRIASGKNAFNIVSQPWTTTGVQ